MRRERRWRRALGKTLTMVCGGLRLVVLRLTTVPYLGRELLALLKTCTGVVRELAGLLLRLRTWAGSC